MANKNVLQSKLKKIRGKVKEEWRHIADHDLDKIVGKRERLVGLVQEKYGDTRERAEQEVDSFLKKMNLRPADDNHAFGVLAVLIGSLLTIAVFLALARRQQASV